MNSAGRPLFVIVALTCGAFIASCELFTTRTPEPPSTGGGPGWQFPESPEIVLSNLNSAMGRRSPVDYGRLFLPDDPKRSMYRFQADPGTAASNPGMFDEWNLAREEKHSRSLFTPASVPLDSVLLSQTVIDRLTVIGDTASLTCGYTIHVGHKILDRPREFEGRADFRLLRIENGGWYIFLWSDSRSSGNACWSDLKALFSAGQ